MRGRWSRSGVVAGAAAGVAGLVLSAVGAVPPPAGADAPGPEPLSVAGMAVPLSLSGELVTWGETDENQGGQSLAVPAEYAGVAFSQVVALPDVMIALTAEGRVVGWGNSQFRIQQIPAAIAAEKVVQIAASPTSEYAGVVTADGRVLVWGVKRIRPTPLNDIPAGLTGVKKLVMVEEMALALKHDGTVVSWGDRTKGVVEGIPEGLLATDVVLATYTATALRTDGSVVQWGNEYGMAGRPESVEDPGSVKAIARRHGAVLAWLEDDSLVSFGNTEPLPATVSAAQPLLLASSMDTGFAMVDQDRVIRMWVKTSHTPAREYPELLPAGLSGRAISHLSIGRFFGYSDGTGGESSGGAIVTKMLRAALPQVAGAATVGSVLTGTPGTFSASPDAVSSQWLVGGVPSGSGAQLTVTAAMVGKTITYASTATKAGETTATSASTPVVVAAQVVPPPVPPALVASSTKVVKVAAAKKGASVSVTGKVTASKSPAGKATVTIAKGKKVIVAKSVAVSAAGAVTLSVKKFAQLVAKKLKAKGKKAKTAYRGAYTVSIAYAGNAQVKASSGSKKFTAKK